MNNTAVGPPSKGFIEEVFFSGDDVMMEYLTVKHSVIPISLTVLYLLWTKSLGPLYMMKKKPYNLRPFMIAYDFVSVVANALVVFKVASLVVRHGIPVLYTEPSVPEHEGIRKEAVDVVWIIYALKFFEMIDTLIFIFRKKLSQISTLHVFHHSSVPLLVWTALRSQRSMLLAIYGVINCIVHIVMYSYYALSALGPKYQKFTKYKRYITLMQIAQFLIMIPYFILLMVMGLASVKATFVLFSAHTTMLLIWFVRFYISRYKAANLAASKVGPKQKLT